MSSESWGDSWLRFTRLLPVQDRLALAGALRAAAYRDTRNRTATAGAWRIANRRRRGGLDGRSQGSGRFRDGLVVAMLLNSRRTAERRRAAFQCRRSGSRSGLGVRSAPRIWLCRLGQPGTRRHDAGTRRRSVRRSRRRGTGRRHRRRSGLAMGLASGGNCRSGFGRARGSTGSDRIPSRCTGPHIPFGAQSRLLTV
jgi:hypothetical protein